MSNIDSISVPKRSLWSLAWLLLWSFIAWGFVVDWLLPVANHLKITADNANAEHLRYAAVPIVSYILIALGVCLVVNVFHPLKSPDENGLIGNLISSFAVGLLFCIVISMFLSVLSVPIIILPGTLALLLMLFGLAGLCDGFVREFKN